MRTELSDDLARDPIWQAVGVFFGLLSLMIQGMDYFERLGRAWWWSPILLTVLFALMVAALVVQRRKTKISVTGGPGGEGTSDEASDNSGGEGSAVHYESEVEQHRRYWLRAAWFGAAAITLLAVICFLPVTLPGPMVYLPRFFMAVAPLSFLGFAILWALRLQKWRGERNRLALVGQVQYALIVIMGAAFLGAADAGPRLTRSIMVAEESILLAIQPGARPLPGKLEWLCGDPKRLAQQGLRLTCSEQTLPAEHVAQQRWFEQQRRKNGYTAVIWVGDGKRVGAIEIPGQLSSATVPRELFISADESWIENGFSILEFASLLRCEEGQSGITQLIKIWRDEGLLPSAFSLQDHPAYAQCLVTAALDSNDTNELEVLSESAGSAIRAALTRAVDLHTQVEWTVVYSRWLSFTGQYQLAWDHFRALSNDHPDWEHTLQDDDALLAIYRQAQGEAALAGCQSSSNPNRIADCDLAVALFESVSARSQDAAGYGSARARILGSIYRSDGVIARADREAARGTLKQVVSRTSEKCLKADARRWISFSQALDGISADSPNWEDHLCRFTVFVDAPRNWREGTTIAAVGLPSAWTDATVELSTPGSAIVTRSTFRPDSRPGTYLVELHMPPVPAAHLTPRYEGYETGAKLELVGRLILVFRDTKGRELARAPVVVAEPYEVQRQIEPVGQREETEAAETITVTIGTPVTVTGWLASRFPASPSLTVLAEPDLTSQVKLCLADPVDESCLLEELSPTARPGYRQSSWVPAAAGVATYTVQARDRLLDTVIATSAPFSIHAQPPPPHEKMVSLVVFQGSVWATVEDAAGSSANPLPLRQFPQCTAARMLDLVEGWYRIDLPLRSATVRGFIGADQVEFLREFAASQLDHLWMGVGEVAIRDAAGKFAYYEPACAIYENQAETPRLWRVAIYRQGEDLPIWGYIDDARAPIQKVRLSKP